MMLKNSLNGILVALVFFQTNLQNASASMGGGSPMKRRLEYDDSTGMDVGPTKRAFRKEDTEIPFYLREDSPNKLTRSNAIDVRKTGCGFCMDNMISVLEKAKTEPSAFGENDSKPKPAEEEGNEKLALIKKMLLKNGHDTPGSGQPATSSFKVGRKRKISQPKRILTNTASNETLKASGGSISETTYIRSNAGVALQDLDNQHPLSSMSRSSVTSLFKDSGVGEASNVNSFMTNELSTPLFRNGVPNINRYKAPKTTNSFSHDERATVSCCNENKKQLQPACVTLCFNSRIDRSRPHKNKENYHRDADNEKGDDWDENAKTEPTSQDDDDCALQPK